jgi:hypothetical protein
MSKDKVAGLLVKPGTPEHGTPEQHHSGIRNTRTPKIPLNLLKIRGGKITGGCEIQLQIKLFRKSKTCF